ncbi:MAG: GNAT family N-acetyltransferase [Nocardioidaceae bacterium]
MAGWTRAEVLKASDDWVWVPPGAERFRVSGVDVIDYPEWARMGFYAKPLDVGEPVEQVVDDVQQAARSRGRDKADWWITPTIRPPALEEQLIARGAEQTEQTDILAYDMSTCLPDTGPTAGVDCMIVSDAVTLEDAERVAARVWGGAPSAGERRQQQLGGLGDPLDAEAGFRVVAYVKGNAIATGGCQVAGDVARLYGACSLPDARGRGGYRALLRRRLEAAREHGATLALVHARVATSKPILVRLGFETYGQGRLYSLPVG